MLPWRRDMGSFTNPAPDCLQSVKSRLYAAGALAHSRNELTNSPSCRSPDGAHQKRDSNRDQHSLLQNGYIVSMGEDQIGDCHSPKMNCAEEALQPIRLRCA